MQVSGKAKSPSLTRLSVLPPLTPLLAAKCAGPIDALLDPAWFKLLAEPTRARLLSCLLKCCRPCTVGEIADCCSVDLSVVSRHLSAMQRAGIVRATRFGRTVHYAVAHENLLARFGALAKVVGDFQATCPDGACCAT